MRQNEYAKLDELIRQLHDERNRDASLDIAIGAANEFMRIIFPDDATGRKWVGALLEGDDLLDETIPASSFPNQKVESWFEKHPYLGGERAAMRHFGEASAPIESKFYWLNRSSAKSRVVAGVMLTPNWEDSDLTKFPDYKVGIDFFMTAEGDALLVALSNEGNLRVLELSEKLSNTQIDILRDIDGAAGFDGIGDLEPQRTIHKTLWDAFALKEVNRRFYGGVAEHFQILLQHLHGKIGKTEEDAKLFANRLIGRLLFIWFLRKKGFVNDDMGYFACEGIAATEYYTKSLKPLFFETLNKPADERKAIDGKIDAKTPFLNGGLFDARPNDWADEIVVFPPDWFESLYRHFEQFNFTTDESTPEYEQVAIDPEMLGRVFENLLASQLDETGKEARKASGSFYTPREIVAYMCKESLREYLCGALGGESARDGVDRLLDMTDKDFEIKHSDAKKSLWGAERTAEMTSKAIQALNALRVIDPACGSGAFPMGMLQLLTKVYTRLGSTLNPYDMKLQILGNSIYGIDIQPMAVEISRLRAWLSIVVDEKDTKNIRPLPNLDFKFVCANTLVPLIEDGKQTTLFDDFNNESLASLDSIMGKGYYTATSPEDKKRLRHEYQYAVVQLEKTSSVQGSKRLKQRISWNPFDSNESSSFFDSETMFNVVDGFDIAIGNPPYIQLQKIKGISAKLYKPLNYETFESTGDIYALFYERGFDLLRAGGVLCYITSNKWMRAAYGKSLRDYFLTKTNPIKLIDFAGTKVFESATVDVSILLGSKVKNVGSVSATIIRDGCQNNLSDYVKQYAAESTFSKGKSWTVLSDIEQSIKRKIEAIGVPLRNWDVDITRGILTGCNEAFIIDGATKERLIAEDPKSAEIIRPILRGRDIKRYECSFKDFWLITTHNGYKKNTERVCPIEINEYPAIKSHLDKFWSRIEKRGDKGITPYNLRNCAYMDDLNKQKILWGEISDVPKFAIDFAGEYCPEATVFMMTGKHLSYLLCSLNSAFSEYFFSKYGTTTGMGTLRWKKYLVELLPVPPLSTVVEPFFIGVASQMAQCEVEERENMSMQIDRALFTAFKFSAEEIKFIYSMIENGAH